MGVVGGRRVPEWRGLTWKEGKGQQIPRDPQRWWAGFKEPRTGHTGKSRCIVGSRIRFYPNLLPLAPPPRGRGEVRGCSLPPFLFGHPPAAPPPSPTTAPPPSPTGEKQRKLKLSPSAASGGFYKDQGLLLLPLLVTPMGKIGVPGCATVSFKATVR